MSLCAGARRSLRALVAACVTGAVVAALAPAQAAPGPTDTGNLQTSAQRERYQRLAEELRCLVCQNQTLADSNADLASDLRRQVEAMILAGRSDDEIKRFMVDRYGDFVLYRPPVQRNTWPLWAGPFALLAIGILVWLRVQRRTRVADTPGPADDAGAAGLERARRKLDE